MNPHDYNLEDFENAEYNEFEADGDDNVTKIALNNSTSPATGTSTSSSIGRTPKKIRLTIWQYFWPVQVTEHEINK